MIRRHRVGDIVEPIPLQKSRQFLGNSWGQSGSVENERRVKLHKGGTGSDLRIGVGAGRNAAAADKRDLAFGQAPEAGETFG